MGLQQIFTEIAKDGFVAEQLSSLVIHHKNVDGFFFIHSRPSFRITPASGRLPRNWSGSGDLTDGATFAKRRAIVPCLPALRGIPRPQLQDTSHGPLSWPSPLVQ